MNLRTKGQPGILDRGKQCPDSKQLGPDPISECLQWVSQEGTNVRLDFGSHFRSSGITEARKSLLDSGLASNLMREQTTLLQKQSNKN